MEFPAPTSTTGVRRLRTSLGLSVRALQAWTARHWLIAVVTATVVGLVLGVATVLIPNPVFGRDLPPVWWNYPVWLVTAALSGLLAATYVRAPGAAIGSPPPAGPGVPSCDREERRTSRMGLGGGLLAWFAVGCPVCNKLALLALGYSGAITWFAPVQPFLAAGAMVLLALALLWRLRGQAACPVPAARPAEAVR